MRALLLSRYGRLGSSSRLRSFQYLDILRDSGWDIDVSPLLDDDYVARLYAGMRPNVSSTARGYAARALALLNTKRYDLIWIERELFPWFPNFIEKLVLPSGIPYILDFDDAVFHRYDMHSSSVVRAALGTKIDRLIRHAAIVIVGNEYLRERAVAAGAKGVRILPTVVDTTKYSTSELVHGGQPVIGWIGSPPTQPFLETISAAFTALRNEADFRVRLIGADLAALPTVDHETVAWSEDSEVEAIQQFDIGIMPLPDSPFARGKCGYKLIQYMACGLPVVASPVGVNTNIVQHGLNGYLATTTNEWIEALRALISDAGLRRKMGARGRELVQERYSLHVAGPELIAIMAAACAR